MKYFKERYSKMYFWLGKSIINQWGWGGSGSWTISEFQGLEALV